MFSTIHDSYMSSGSSRMWDPKSYVSRALRFLVRRPHRLKETLGSGNENGLNAPAIIYAASYTGLMQILSMISGRITDTIIVIVKLKQLLHSV